MRDFIFSVLLGSLLLSLPASAADEVIATCSREALKGGIPTSNLVAYGAVSGGRLYLKKVELKVGDVTVTPRLDQGVEFGYIPESDNSVIRTHPLPASSKPAFTSDKLSVQLALRSKEVRDQVDEFQQSTFYSFTIEATPGRYIVSFSGQHPISRPGIPGAWEQVGDEFRACTLSQAAKDAVEAAHLARVATKTGIAAKITVTPTSAAF